MKSIALALALFIFVFGLYRSIVGVTYTKGASVSASEFECSKTMAALSMDNPIERLPLTSIHIDKIDSGSTIATAYFLVLPYSRFEIAPDCHSSRRI